MRELGLDGFQGQFYPGNVIVPAQLTANQNDWNPTGMQAASVIFVTSDQPRSITGLAGGKKGRALLLVNSSTNADGDVVLRAKSTSSVAANRFAFDTDIVMEPTEAVFLVYDHVNSFWTRGASRRYTGGTFRRNPYWVADMMAPIGTAAHVMLPWGWTTISVGTQAKIAGTANHPGIVRIATPATSGAGGGFLTSNDAILIGGGERAEFVFQIPTLTNNTIRMGFHDCTTSADAVDGCYIEIPSTGAAVGKTSSNSVRTTSATIATLSTATWYVARIDVRKDLTGVDFYILDDNGNQLGTQSNTTNLPSGAGRNCGHGVIATVGAAVATSLLDLDFMSLEFTRALV